MKMAIRKEKSRPINFHFLPFLPSKIYFFSSFSRLSKLLAARQESAPSVGATFHLSTEMKWRIKKIWKLFFTVPTSSYDDAGTCSFGSAEPFRGRECISIASWAESEWTGRNLVWVERKGREGKELKCDRPRPRSRLSVVYWGQPQ